MRLRGSCGAVSGSLAATEICCPYLHTCTCAVPTHMHLCCPHALTSLVTMRKKPCSPHGWPHELRTIQYLHQGVAAGSGGKVMMLKQAEGRQACGWSQASAAGRCQSASQVRQTPAAPLQPPPLLQSLTGCRLPRPSPQR